MSVRCYDIIAVVGVAVAVAVASTNILSIPFLPISLSPCHVFAH